ncbi:hypothetical protein [Nocardia neocaledoniensis]|uniref:hypothetical protein n=1 Tax=Nocardia neocaledoniensis TaxID=236511 RepID=UPI0024577F62|nr:hypothetical protein [Nocardia neocaledoniensis]
MTTIRLDHPAAGIVTLRPDGAPTVLDGAPALDTLVLEVAGGHLTWSLLTGQQLPAATLDDTEAAQDWLWAVYGENTALAVADDEGHHRELTATPARPELVTALRRLAYAHWASRWWPASTVDNIPALDPAALAKEIAALSEVCEAVLSGADDPDTAGVHGSTDEPSAPRHGEPAPSGGRGASRHDGRAEDYALAAGGEASGTGLALARGAGDWDWRCCPPGLVDAGARSVSWQVRRGGGVTTVEVAAIAAPDCPRDVPEHLRPLARLRAADALAEVPLVRRGDAWVGELRTSDVIENLVSVGVFVRSVGSDSPLPDESAMRASIRDLVRHRLAGTGDDLLAAERAAAEDDSDF